MPTLEPPQQSDMKNLPYTLQEWLRKLRDIVQSTVGSIPWASVNKAGSNLNEIVTRAHNVLQSIQGGAANDYYHLTAAQHTQVSVATSGTYTPTLTNTTNVAASTAYECQYLRVGNTVTVSGKVDIDPTGAGQVVLGMSIPVASNFGTQQDLGGVAFSPAVASLGAAVLADSTNDRATVEYIAVDTSNRSFYFTFTYQVI